MLSLSLLSSLSLVAIRVVVGVAMVVVVVAIVVGIVVVVVVVVVGFVVVVVGNFVLAGGMPPGPYCIRLRPGQDSMHVCRSTCPYQSTWAKQRRVVPTNPLVQGSCIPSCIPSCKPLLIVKSQLVGAQGGGPKMS